MASKSFRCRLVIPTTSLVDEQVAYASVPAWDGLFGVLPGRGALLARLGTGELRLDFPDAANAEGGSRSYVIDGGFVRMAGDQLTILAERAVAAETINRAEAEAELKASESAPPPPAGPTGQAARDRARRDRDFAKAKVRVATSARGI